MTDTVFADAAESIARNGHHKGDYYDAAAPGELAPEASPVCLLGALCLSLYDHPVPFLAPQGGPTELEIYAARIAARLGLQVGEGLEGAQTAVSNWNDAEERTPEEVITALRALGESGGDADD